MIQPAPTLISSRNQSAAVGAATVAGLAAILVSSNPQPAPAQMGAQGRAPTVVIQSGPVSGTELDKLYLYGRTPSLQTIRVISPSLPMGEPELNDLTPEVVFQETALVARDYLYAQGRAPQLVLVAGDSTLALPIPGGLSVAGLAPSVSIPVGEETVKAVDASRYEVIGLVASLHTTTIISPELVSITFGSGTPGSQRTTGWVDVPRQAPAGWTGI